MLEEEGAVIVGLLVGLNVIDANLCVKGEDLDSQVTAASDSRAISTWCAFWSRNVNQFFEREEE